MLPDDASNPFRITFDVYKPVSQFKKSNPGPPNYCIAVVNARETAVPTLAELNDLLATTPYDPPNPTSQMYQKLKYGSRNIILAVVDNGIPSYIRLADAPFEHERLYERIGRGRGGKRGGFRGRGRGRGRGR
jgi:tRNA-splicing endonuclease subunit Sen54